MSPFVIVAKTALKIGDNVMNIKNEQSYLGLLQQVLENGECKGDRTGTGTLSCFGAQMRFNLRDGFPLVTTKKIPFKSMATELLWFISGSSNERDLCLLTHGTKSEDKNTIWTPNAKDRALNNPERFNGNNVGNMYGWAWRNKICNPHSHTMIKRRTYIDNYEIEHIQPKLDKVYKEPKVRTSKSCGDFINIGKQGDKFVVKFINTGSYRIVNNINFAIKDLFAPTREGIGYKGGEIPDNITTKKLTNIWNSMMVRVYTSRPDKYPSYKKVKICKRWHSLKNFIEDCYSIIGFQEYIDSNYKYELDKDYFGSDIYSPNACIFLSPEMNKTLNSGGKEDFKIYVYDNKSFYSRTDLQNYRGKHRRAELPENLKIICSNITHVIRPIIFIDQLSSIISKIKSDPNSRRLVIDSWNVRDIENAALGICHPMFQFFVSNGQLSCQLYQRSADLFLGVPFNIASYALLTHMIAHVCDLEVGEFIWTGGDCHIYKNHIDQVKLQLSRKPYELPTLGMNPHVKNIFDFKYEDFWIVDYESHPSIKAPVAI